jgi:hypothetical protein
VIHGAAEQATMKRRRKRATVKIRGKAVLPAKADDGYKQAVMLRAHRYGVRLEIAKTQEIGHGLGRLLMAMTRNRKISGFEASIILDVAARCEEAISAYHTHVLDAPSPTPAAVDLNRIGGFSLDTLPDDAIESIRRRYNRIRSSVKAMENWRALERYALGDTELERWKVGDVLKLLRALDAVRDGS